MAAGCLSANWPAACETPSMLQGVDVGVDDPLGIGRNLFHVQRSGPGPAGKPKRPPQYPKYTRMFRSSRLLK